MSHEKIRITCKANSTMGLDEIVPLQGELKSLTEENFEKLKRSILKYGVSFPIFVWRSNGKNFIVDGTQRDRVLLKMREEGYRIPRLPVDYIEAKDEKEAKEKILLLSSQYGEMTDESLYGYLAGANLDFGGLKDLLALPQIDLERFEAGWIKDGGEITEAHEPQIDKAAELQKKWKTARGQIWEIGKHRLMCGDCTNAEDVTNLMNEKYAGAIITDPPYGMNLDTDWSGIRKTGKSLGFAKKIKGKAYASVIGDDKPFDPGPIFKLWTTSTAELFLFGADYYAERIPDRENGSWLVWDKRKESQADGFGSEFELIWSKQKHKRRILRHEWFGFLREGEHGKPRMHLTQKPVSLIVDIINQWCPESNIADSFLGSGTTMIAAEQLGRICYGMEIDPGYVAVSLQRMANMGLKPRLLNSPKSKPASRRKTKNTPRDSAAARS